MSPCDHRSRGDQVLRTDDAAIGERDPRAPEQPHGFCEHRAHRREIERTPRAREQLQIAEARPRDEWWRRLCALGQELFELRVGDRLDEHAREKAVRERGERRIFRQRIARGHADLERDRSRDRAATKLTLVQDPEQRVQDRRGSEEHLVQEATSASGSIPAVTVSKRPCWSFTRSIGPKISLGSVKRPSKYSK